MKDIKMEDSFFMKQVILLLIACIVITSCSKEEVSEKSFVSFSLPAPYERCDVNINETTRTCKEVFELAEDSKYLCITDSIGKFKLSQESKLLSPYSCQQVGNQIRFKSGKGDIETFSIIEKENSKVSVATSSFQPCDSTSTRVISRKIGYCYEIERMYTVLLSENGIRLYIEIKPEVYTYYRSNSLFGTVKDRISIYSTQYSKIYSLLSEISPNKVNFKDSLTFMGYQFYDVYTQDNTEFTEPKPTFYYNSEYGIFGYIDMKGVRWLRVE
jgi:hypothetical protein